MDIPELRSAPAGSDVGLRQLLTSLASTHFVLTDEQPLLKTYLIRVRLRSGEMRRPLSSHSQAGPSCDSAGMGTQLHSAAMSRLAWLTCTGWCRCIPGSTCCSWCCTMQSQTAGPPPSSAGS